MFFRVRPLPEVLEYYLGISNLTGKMLEDYAMLEKPMAVGFLCRTLGRPDRGFNVVLNDRRALAVDSLRDNLLTTLNGIVGAFDAVGPASFGTSSPRGISSHRFTALYEDFLSRLNLRAISAIRRRAAVCQ